MTQEEAPIDRVREYLRQLSPQARSRLLAEIERLQMCGDDIPGTEALLVELRAEFRKDGQTHDRIGNPSRFFFQPLEPLLIDRAPEHANAGQISRGSLSPIWEWISRNLMPTMARDYADKMKTALTANNQREAQLLAATFQVKAVKYLEGTLASGNGTEHTRAGLAKYTSARATFDDVLKMLTVLRARDALAEFGEALSPKIDKFEGERLDKVRALLDAFVAKNAEALPFALTLVARRLKTPWQLIRLATKSADSKDVLDIAETPYAMTVSMVLDQLDEKRVAIRKALHADRIPIAKDILAEAYETEYALRVRLDELDDSEWGVRLDGLMEAIAVMLETEVQNLPGTVRHVLGSRSLRSYDSLSGRLTYLAWKGRDALSDGANYCKSLVGLGQKSHG
jgi:hypothetical protein